MKVEIIPEVSELKKQTKKINGQISPVMINFHGVPQGTLLGPDFFVLNINDIVKVIEKCKTQLSADDAVLLKSINK